MRVTNQILRERVLQHIEESHTAIADVQGEISSGRRITYASDDPAAASQAFHVAAARTAIDQHTRNIKAATSRLSMEEAVLGSLTTSLDRARELAVAQGTALATPASRLTAKAEVDGILRDALAQGNTRYQDGYLFGGYSAQTRPFTQDGPPFAATEPSGALDVQISANELAPSSHDGREVFLDTGTLAALHDLSTALGTNDTAGIQKAESSLKTSSDRIQGLLGEVGARTARLDSASSMLASIGISLDDQHSALVDTDVERATIGLMQRQTTLQAALLTTQRILGVSLTEYLR